MSRRIFISYQHKDHDQAKGFNLLRWNKNVKYDFVGRHLLSPVNSENRDYIRRQIKEQIKGTSVTVVLIGKETHTSDWVADEVSWSLEKGNGILGIKLDSSAKVPASLIDCGAEVMDWKPHEFDKGIERAAKAAGRAEILRNTTTPSGSCGRRPC